MVADLVSLCHSITQSILKVKGTNLVFSIDISLVEKFGKISSNVTRTRAYTCKEVCLHSFGHAQTWIFDLLQKLRPMGLRYMLYRLIVMGSHAPA